ncbi:hypothetical protein JOF29_003100 [Kribbella aluminosa]|uniref:Uncharacterized protein n=1 Tax=Kribbella aluminosa TaxID=416017 RepID=A0ABS4UK32_9ACTN|nr:hypothetical protein [Kribbella aluminosa]MBP2352017.1 hypothetical protein [Kribbella aluminosa]
MVRDPSGEVAAVTTEPGVVADDAAGELAAAETSDAEDPTSTTALESGLENLAGAAQALEED